MCVRACMRVRVCVCVCRDTPAQTNLNWNRLFIPIVPANKEFDIANEKHYYFSNSFLLGIKYQRMLAQYACDINNTKERYPGWGKEEAKLFTECP